MLQEESGHARGSLLQQIGFDKGLALPRQASIGLLVVAMAFAELVLASRLERTMAVFWAFGLAFGFVLQRSRFCFTSAFRDLFLLRYGRTMKGLLVGMAVATIGFAIFMSRLTPNTRLGLFPPEAHIIPLGWHLIVGGLLFGFAMVLAGGCVSGSIYRMGEGYVASWVAFGGIMVGLLVANHTWNWWWRFSISDGPRVWLPHTLGYGGAVLVTLLGLGLIYLLVLWWESRGGVTLPEGGAADEPGETFASKLQAALKSFFVTGWSAKAGGIALGTMNVFLYVFAHPWGMTGEIGRWANTLAGFAGLGPALQLGLDTLAACAVVVSEGGWVNHMTFLVVGMVVGSLIAALFAHEFKLRKPRQRVRYLQASGGGLLMGYGAGIAMGCTLGGFFSAVPSLAANGWVFGLCLAAGAYLGTKVISRIP